MPFPPLAHAAECSDPPVAAADQPLPVEREARTKLFLAAQLFLAGELPRDVRIRDLSPSGARVDAPSLPLVGATVLLRRGAAEVAAEVMWVAGGSCGLRFTQIVDVASLRSDRPSAVAAQVMREPNLADDLALARRLVERLEHVLGGEPAVVAALGTELQAVDLLGQLLQTSEKRAHGSTAPAMRSLVQAVVTYLRTPLPGK